MRTYTEIMEDVTRACCKAFGIGGAGVLDIQNYIIEAATKVYVAELCAEQIYVEQQTGCGHLSAEQIKEIVDSKLSK